MRIVVAVLVSLVFVACGGSGGGGPTEAAINLTSAGASPNNINLPTGGRVHFFNKDTVDHQVASACAELASPRLSPGGDNLGPTMTGPRTCTFSDALTSAPSFNGTVTVNAPGTGGGGGY